MKYFELYHTPNNKINFCWIPGHFGIPGNGRANMTANASNITDKMLTDPLQAVKFFQNRIWQRMWDR